MSDPHWPSSLIGFGRGDFKLRELWEDIVGIGDLLSALFRVNTNELIKAEGDYSKDLCRCFGMFYWDHSGEQNKFSAPPEGFPTVHTLIDEVIPLAERNLAKIKARGNVDFGLQVTPEDPEDGG